MRLVAIWMLTKVFGHDLHNADIMASFMRTPAPALTQVASQTKAVESLPKEVAAEAASLSFCQMLCLKISGGLLFLFDSINKIDSGDHVGKPFWNIQPAPAFLCAAC